MGLREEITDAVRMATAADQPGVSARRIVNAVMGVVKEDHGREKCVRFGIYEEAEAAKARIATALELHQPYTPTDDNPMDENPMSLCTACDVLYPCGTVLALGGKK